MGASDYTDALELPLFADADKPTWRGDINDAMSKIDAGYVELENIYVEQDSQVLFAADHITNYDNAGDRTSQVQAFFTNIVRPGDSVMFGPGTVRMDGAVTCPHNDVTVLFRRGCTIDRSQGTPGDTDGFIFTGNNVTVSGPGTIISPATFYPQNTQWDHAVLLFKGDSPSCLGMRLVNVPRVGIGFRDVSGLAIARENKIVGNFPAASWDEVGTMHAGINYDPSLSGDPKPLITGNSVSSCVQGVFLGNYGTGQSYGGMVVNNDFFGCHNHGIYGNVGVDYTIIRGNRFRDCSRIITMTGEGHIVAHNSATVSGTSGNLFSSLNINMRNAVGCTVVFNTMKGDMFNTAPAIDLAPVNPGVIIKDNKVIGNTIIVTGTVRGSAIRIGNGNATDMRNNLIAQNMIVAVGITTSGIIAVFGNTGSQARGTSIIDNHIVALADGACIYISEHNTFMVRGNHMEVGYDAGAAQIVYGVNVQNNSKNGTVAFNEFVTTAAFGTNITFRTYQENANAGPNRVEGNRWATDTTKATITRHIMSNNGSMMRESGPGAPAIVAGPGSQWYREDGAASTSFYVKESAATAATWQPK